MVGGGRVGGWRTRNRVGVAAVIVPKAAAALPPLGLVTFAILILAEKEYTGGTESGWGTL
jgi:hypothetical protein